MIYKKVSVLFEREFVLGRRSASLLPVEQLLTRLNESFALHIRQRDLVSCELLLGTQDQTDFAEKLHALIRSLFGQESADRYTLSVSEIDGEDRAFLEKKERGETSADERAEEEAAAEASETEKTPQSARETQPDPQQVLDEIRLLVGASEFKSLCEDVARLAPGLVSCGLGWIFLHRTYLFSVGDGNGLSTYLSLFGRLTDALGLTVRAGKKPVIECQPLSPQDKSGQDPFESVLSRMGRTATAGCIVCVDIREWLTHTAESAFLSFLRKLDNLLGDRIVVFRAPFLELEVLKRLQDSIEDVLSVRTVSVAPFTNRQLLDYAALKLSEMASGLEPTKKVWDMFRRRIDAEKSDGRFYGLDTVDKLLREMIYLKFLNAPADRTPDLQIRPRDIAGFCPEEMEDERSALEQFDDYIGMEKIRARVQELVSQILLARKNPELGAPCLHMRFVGNPGTGKTTVARLVAKMLAEKGVLRVGGLIECAGRDLCGQYVGHTAPKTSAYCRDAYGSVLFIDEAYSLYRDASSDNRDFGREAIDTLIAQMENHRSDLVVIMAGYPEEMETLMQANPGLESRMPYLIEFENYTREELFSIYMKMAESKFALEEGFASAVRSYFDGLPEEVLQTKTFSNARFVRNLFERTWSKAAARYTDLSEETLVLTCADFAAASREREFVKMQEKPRRALGFL